MRIIILLLIMKEEQAFLRKYLIIRKFALKFLKISLHFLVEDGKPFHLICELFSTDNNEGGVGFLLALQTDIRTNLPFFLNLLVILIPMVYNTLWLLE